MRLLVLAVREADKAGAQPVVGACASALAACFRWRRGSGTAGGSVAVLPVGANPGAFLKVATARSVSCAGRGPCCFASADTAAV